MQCPIMSYSTMWCSFCCKDINRNHMTEFSLKSDLSAFLLVLMLFQTPHHYNHSDPQVGQLRRTLILVYIFQLCIIACTHERTDDVFRCVWECNVNLLQEIIQQERVVQQVVLLAYSSRVPRIILSWSYCLCRVLHVLQLAFIWIFLFSTAQKHAGR